MAQAKQLGGARRGSVRAPRALWLRQTSGVMLDAVPVDVWVAHLGPRLDHRDLVSVARCCSWLRQAVHAVRCQHGITVRHEASDVLADARWHALRHLAIKSVPRRLVNFKPLPELDVTCLTGLPRLESLDLYHPRLPSVPVWPTVFRACPLLRRVRVVGDFYMSNYARDVNHCVDLVTWGAPRLEALDVEGGWMVICPRGRPDDDDISAATRRAITMPPVPSSALTRYRAACKQAAVSVDAPRLRHLEVEESGQETCFLARMGPRTRAAVRTLEWKAARPSDDALRSLGLFGALESAELHLGALSVPQLASAAVRGLASLPAGVRRLALHLDLWVMSPDDSDIEWGTPLQHLRSLEEVYVEATFAPATTDQLLAHWLGAGPSTRRVRAKFHWPAAHSLRVEMRTLMEEGADSEDESMAEVLEGLRHATAPICDGGLRRWLDARPLATAQVAGLDGRLVCAHPRCCVID